MDPKRLGPYAIESRLGRGGMGGTLSYMSPEQIQHLDCRIRLSPRPGLLTDCSEPALSCSLDS